MFTRRTFYCCWNYNRSAQFVCPNHNFELPCDGDSTPYGESLNPQTLTHPGTQTLQWNTNVVKPKNGFSAFGQRDSDTYTQVGLGNT